MWRSLSSLFLVCTLTPGDSPAASGAGVRGKEAEEAEAEEEERRAAPEVAGRRPKAARGHPRGRQKGPGRTRKQIIFLLVAPGPSGGGPGAFPGAVLTPLWT
eukprot:6582175-Pyramimonas_sp.AAC.1